MNLLILLSIILSVMLSVGRFVDLTLFIDPATGLCTVGSVWLRYLALGLVLAVAVAAGNIKAAKYRDLCSRCAPSGAVSLLGGVSMLLAAAGQLWLVWLGAQGRLQLVWALLTAACGVWLLCLGRAWLRRGTWKNPTASLVPAVLGSAVFYWGVLLRFMENSSSWHRVGPTAQVWQMLAAVVFLGALARALYLPQTARNASVCAGGLAAFALCFCWTLPELLLTLASDGVWTLLTGGLFDLGLCCVGALGGVCAVRVADAGALSSGRHKKMPRHAAPSKRDPVD